MSSQIGRHARWRAKTKSLSKRSGKTRESSGRKLNWPINLSLRMRRPTVRSENWRGRVTSISWSSRRSRNKLNLREGGHWPKNKASIGNCEISKKRRRSWKKESEQKEAKLQITKPCFKRSILKGSRKEETLCLTTTK